MTIVTRRGLWLPTLGIAAGAAVAGCTPSDMATAVSKMAKIAADPSLPVGAPGDQPSIANISVYAEDDVNKNETGQPSPVDVWLFLVGDPDKLQTTDFFALTADPKTALGTDYVDHKDMQVRPGKRKLIKDWKFKEDTRYFAVVAGYRDLQGTVWSASEEVHPTGEDYNILIVLKAKTIAIHVSR